MQTQAVPEDAVALESEGFHVTADPRYDGSAMFRLIFPEGQRITVCSVNLPMENQYQQAGQRPDGALISPDLRGNLDRMKKFYPSQARAIAEVFIIAADYAAALNSCYMDQLRVQAEQYRAKQHEAQTVEQRKEASRSELYEHIKWMIEDQIRLKRYNKRSTVFGTIKRIVGPDKTRRPYMDIITERGKPMTIFLEDITILEQKQENRRYIKVYENGKVVAA